jgi:hypothetical protein
MPLFMEFPCPPLLEPPELELLLLLEAPPLVVAAAVEEPSVELGRNEG